MGSISRKKNKIILEKNFVKGMSLAMGAAIFWGLSGNCGQYLFTYKNIDPSWLTAVRLLVAGSFLAVMAFLKGNSSKEIWHNKHDLLKLALFSVFGVAFCQYTYLLTISYSNAGTATVLQYLGPVIVLLVSCVMAKRLPKRLEVVAIVFALLGTLLLATHGKIGTLALAPKALFWGLIAAVTLMLYTLMPGGLIKKYGSIPVSAYAMLLSGVLFALVLRLWQWEIVWDWQMLLALSGVVVPGTMIAYLFYLKALVAIGPLKTSLFATIEPLAAVGFSAIWLNTSFAAADYLGLVSIILMVILITLQK